MAKRSATADKATEEPKQRATGSVRVYKDMAKMIAMLSIQADVDAAEFLDPILRPVIAPKFAAMFKGAS